jgi:putative ATPase
MDLFSSPGRPLPRTPLAERLRPRTLEEYEGQAKLLGEGRALRRMLERDELPSLILWGPPGTGKTTLAALIATLTKAKFLPFSGVSGTVKDIREILKDADDRRKFYGERTILFVDEIHRFNKSQQDAFLPAVEKGIVTLIGATTENPSFEINPALLSRCRVVILEQLDDESLNRILNRALIDDERGLGRLKPYLDPEAQALLVRAAAGDARALLTSLDMSVALAEEVNGNRHVTLETAKDALQRSLITHDKDGESHYNLISALHKSVRGHDADAAVYYLARLLEAGEDPLFVARRLVRMAAEDIGLADPQALPLAVAAFDATYKLGMPEANIILAECTIYLARAPKSVAAYEAYKAAAADVHNLPNLPVPLHLRNAPTGLMKDLGYGQGYKYTPNFSTPTEAAQQYLPDALKDRKYL